MTSVILPVDIVVSPDLGGVASGMTALIAVFAILFVGIAIFGVIIGVRKYRILKDAGTDQFTVDAAIAAKVLRSDVLAPSSPTGDQRPIEAGLAELDDLHARGVISADEHSEARAAVLRG